MAVKRTLYGAYQTHHITRHECAIDSLDELLELVDVVQHETNELLPSPE
jgi:hypothetical protein